MPEVRLPVPRTYRRICHDDRVAPSVLIVDDHPSFRASARAILEADGFTIVGEAEDGPSWAYGARYLLQAVHRRRVQQRDAPDFHP